LAEFVDFQTRRLDQLDRRAAAAAALSESLPWPSEAVLPGRESRRFGTNVLDEQQLTTRMKHPDDLLQREIGRVDGTQDQR
jgi:hypothetical protein